MRPAAKVVLVASGYVAAWLAAQAVVAIHASATNGGDVVSDRLYFLGAFGLVAVLPTAAALIFLRPYPRFWLPLTITGVTLAASGLLAVAAFLLARGHPMGSFLQTAAGLSVLRILVAPIVTLLLGVAGVIAPTRGPRVALLVAAAVEAAGFTCVATIWTLGIRL